MSNATDARGGCQKKIGIFLSFDTLCKCRTLSRSIFFLGTKVVRTVLNRLMNGLLVRKMVGNGTIFQMVIDECLKIFKLKRFRFSEW